MIKTTDLEKLHPETPSRRATFSQGQQGKLPRLRTMNDGYGVISRSSNQKNNNNNF